MHFDHLDEIYAMVQSNWWFDKLFLTGLYERSDWSVQIVQKTWIVPILGVNICPCFLVKLAYRETFLQAKTVQKQWEALMHQSHLVSNDEGIRLTTYLDMAQDDGFTLLLIFLHLLWDMNLSTHHFGYDCLESGSKSISHFKWPCMHKLTQLHWIAIGLLSSIITTESI